MIIISFLDNIKNKLNTKNPALELQKKIINDLDEGKSFHDAIGDDKEIVVQWYVKGRRGNELYANFYNQLKTLASGDLMIEDLTTIVDSVKESGQFLNTMQNFVLFNDPLEINEWYLKGRDGDAAYSWFYNSIKQYAFQDVIRYDEKLLFGLLDDGVDLDVALNSSKIFSSKREFKENEYPLIKSFVEKHSKEAIVFGLKEGKQFSDLIESEDIYNTPEEIISWYEQGRNGELEHVEFYRQALPFVVKQDYNKVSEAINEGVPIEELLSLTSVISSNQEFNDYLPLHGSGFESFIEQDMQKAILNSCLSGASFGDAIKSHVLKYNPKDFEIWYRLGRGGDSQYKDFFDNISPFVLKDDCETIFAAVEQGKTLIEAIEDSEILNSKEFMEKLYSMDEFESGDIAALVNRTIELLISNTNYSLIGFDFNAENENVNQWIELGKLGIYPFKEFYDEYLIYITQSKVIEALNRDELFINAVNTEDLPYKAEEIIDWFLKGKNGERYVEFYEKCAPFTINETKQNIIDHLEMYHSFNQAIKQHGKFHGENEIREWFNKGKNGEEHVEFYETCMEIMNQFKGSINSLADLLTPKYEKKLKSAVLTVEEYDEIIEEIYRMGESLVKFDEDDSTFDKVSKIVNAYAPWSYKSKGGESGFYMSNFIKLDDRLLVSQKIATLIHELTHHLVSEILEIALCYMLDVEKTQAIEGFVAFFLMDPLTKIMNEYCASTVEGRFILHGFQNYGAYDIAMEECSADGSIKELYTYMGNTLADDIISLLERFIDEDLRNDIKNQFIDDRFPPRYDGIYYECSHTVPKDVTIGLLSEAIVDYYNLAKNSDAHKHNLKVAYDSFDKSYQ